MNIIKNINTSTGIPISLHRVQSIKLGRTTTGEERHIAFVLSWSDLAQYASGASPIHNESHTVLISNTSGINFFQQATNYLITTDTSIFFGGTIDDGTVAPNTLDGAKTLKRIEMQAARTAAETGGFTWNAMQFSSSFEEQGRLAAAVTVAIVNKIDATAFNMKWQLKDGSNTTLNKNEFIDVAKALADHINAVFEIWRTKRAAINAATTIEEVNAIVW